MAKNRQMQQEEEQDEFEQQVENKVKEAQMQYRMDKSRKDFSQKMEQLANRAAEFVMQYGKDDYRAQIMLTFLDVSMQMEDAINLLHDVGLAMSCINEAINCMDGLLGTNELFVENSLSRKYGFFARWKRKRRLNKAIRNNVGRMTQICDSLVGNQKMALSIVDSLKKSSMKMKKLMEKNAQKHQQKEAKANPAAVGQPSKAEEMVAGIVKSRGGSYDAGASGSGAADSGLAAGGSSPAGGVDDISDII